MSSRAVRPLEAAFALLVLAALAALAGHWVLDGVIHSRKTQTVPDLRGRPVLAAMDVLAPLNLGMKKDGVEFDASVPVGAVLRQQPAAGTVVREGKVIRVTLSQGGEAVFVPNIVGLPLRSAELLLRQSLLVLGEVREAPSLKYEKGAVLSQEPKSDVSVERDALVSVTVSAGAPPAGVRLMPDFLRKNISEAEAWAEAEGVAHTVSADAGSSLPHGVIISQTPPADSVLAGNAAAQFVISGKPAKGRPQPPAAKTFHYELSQGGGDQAVRVVVADKHGEREIFNETRKPGSKIDIPIREAGGSRIKIFINGTLVEESDL